MEPGAGRERTLEAVARLAGGIAHELNNALMPVQAYGEIALEKLAAGENVERELEEILAPVRRTAGLTRGLLAFSGRHVPRADVIDLDDLVARLVERLVEPPAATSRSWPTDTTCRFGSSRTPSFCIMSCSSSW